MKKIVLPNNARPVSSAYRYMFWFSGALLLGIVAGVLTASCLNLTAKQALFSDVTQFLYMDHSEATTFCQVLWQICRIPLLILLLSFTCFGVVCIPVAVGLQGYLFSFSVAVMVRLLGLQGLLLGIASFGIQALFLLPCLLVLSGQCFRLSGQFLSALLSFAKREVPERISFPRGFLLAMSCSCIVLFVGAALDFFFTEKLISFVSNLLIV